MLNVNIIPSEIAGEEIVVLKSPAVEKVWFESHLQARKWQFKMIFGVSPDSINLDLAAHFTDLEGEEISYLEEVFCFKDNFSPKLVTGEPCREQHLQNLASKLGRKVVVSTYLAEPKYD